MLFLNMSQAIVVPRKPFDGILAISEFTKKSVFLFSGAVTARYVTLDILRSVELLMACRIVAGKVLAMSFDMFPTKYNR